MRTILALLLAVPLVACRTASSPADAAMRDIDAFVANVVRTIPEVPSIAVAVVHDGRTHTGAFGLADLERQVKATPETGYYIGSTTKAFTGLVAAILSEQGAIDLDAPVTTWLTGVRFPAPIDARKVTLRRLLSHTPSIQNEPIVFRTAFSGDHTPEVLLQLLETSKPREESFGYDNLGYVVAGLVFERVTGKNWQQLHEELIFTPLGMDRTTPYMSEAGRAAPAMPYDMTNAGRVALLAYRKNDRMMHAAGGTMTTAKDLTRWLEANITGGRIGGRRIFPELAMAEIQKQQATVGTPRAPFAGTAYGFGWYRGTLAAQPVLFHGGGFEGWRSLFLVMPDKGIGVGVLTNSGVAGPVPQLITSYICDRLLGTADLESAYAAKLAKLRAGFDAKNAAVIADTQQRANREWQLRHDRASYAGVYENRLYGTMHIEQQDGGLYASIGTMRGELEPYTEPESARVELIPATGEVLHFVFPDGARASALKFRDELFTRTE